MQTAELLKNLAHNNPQVHTVMLRHNTVSPPLLAQAISANTVVTQLLLGENCFSDSDIETLLDALHTDCRIRTLELSQTALTFSGAVHLAAWLTNNTSVTRLDLSNNPTLGSPGIDVLCKALRCRHNVQHLDLSNTRMGDDGASHVANLLKSPSCGLQRLYLSENRITSGGIENLVEALEQNRSLIAVNLWNNPVTIEQQSRISRFINRNKATLKEQQDKNSQAAESAAQAEKERQKKAIAARPTVSETLDGRSLANLLSSGATSLPNLELLRSAFEPESSRTPAAKKQSNAEAHAIAAQPNPTSPNPSRPREVVTLQHIHHPLTRTVVSKLMTGAFASPLPKAQSSGDLAKTGA
eukprot:TRINITY_DN1935_c0_g1_i1.p1 TRINITY_DN1935_c0_g1~~TRINITY_DN1935_c0_g1_i1.p1  ORF type:complete len:355 (-),score=63.30 TRINITY_DN1935_c0_g1_i1:15-1079(-)